jgi:hypothetical protein
VSGKNGKKCESVSSAFAKLVEQSIQDAKIEGSGPTTTRTWGKRQNIFCELWQTKLSQLV